MLYFCNVSFLALTRNTSFLRPQICTKGSCSSCTRRAPLFWLNCSEQYSEGLSGSQLEQTRLYLERKYKFFEKKFSTRKTCSSCEGTGKVLCKFCNGTGFMTLGDTLLCSVTGNCDCVVCKAQGEVNCDKCCGTGYLAGWL